MQDEIKRLLSSAEPEPDESFTGYLLRLAELNDYDTLSWILQMARLRDYANQSPSYSLDPSFDLSPLSQLSGVEESKLAALQYHPIRVSENRMMGDYSVFGSPLPHYLIRLERPKICPACLQEKNYARRVWDLAVATACPLHKCLLLDECPSCRKRIAWNRSGINLCRCGYDWREYKATLVDDSQLAVARRIHVLCSLPARPQIAEESRSNNPLYKLGLRQFISALIFVASQFAGVAERKGQRILDTKGKHFAPSRRNSEIHTLLCKALPVFDDWPNNYHSFLDWRRAQYGASKSMEVRGNYFAGYKSALFVQLGSTDFEFMRSAFREYRRIRRCDSYAAGSGKTANRKENRPPSTKASGISIPGQTEVRISKLYETHVSGKKAVKALKTTWPGLEGLIASGRLRAIIGTKEGRKFYFVDKASLDELKEKLERSLFLKQVERLLGVHFARIKELIECRLLTPLRGPDVDGCGDWRFDQEEVSNLIERLTNGLSKKRSTNKQKALSFKLVLRKIGRAGISLGTLLQAVLDGEIKPCGKGQEGGFRGLLFRKDQIRDYVQSEIRLLTGDALSLSEAANLLGVTRHAVDFLAKKGLLHAERFASAPSLGMLVKKEDFDLFNETYLLTREIASEYGTSTEFLINLLSERGIHPVTGAKVDGGRVYLIRKNEVKSLDLAALISEENKKRAIAWKIPFSKANSGSNGLRKTSKSKLSHLLPKTAQWWVLDEEQTAEILEMDVETVRQLAERGALQPHKRLSGDKQKDEGYYFSRYIVQKYKSRSVDHTGLIAYMAAARLFDLWPDNFYNKFVKTGRLKPVIADGERSDYFFRVEDVETLLEVEKQTIITPEAAEILEVYVSSINKMIAAGVLKPISGPAVDGFGKNLFLRSDVERLHKEREAFKAERMKEGKSSRFGKQAGSKAGPVLNVIGPRIDQLIEKWHDRGGIGASLASGYINS